jgi:S1-C subfamily serine protease
VFRDALPSLKGRYHFHRFCGRAKKGGTPCYVLASDPQRDLSLLKIIGDDNHQPIPMATKSAEPGVSLFTIGSTAPVLWRYAGGNARAVYDDSYEFPSQKIVCKVLEMSCPINPGDSGGPIIAKGELVGISSCIVKDKNLIQKGIDITEIHAFLKWAKQ